MRRIDLSEIDTMGFEELTFLSDYELERRISRLINSRYDQQLQRRVKLEIEIAYAQREAQIRQHRWDEHMKYIAASATSEEHGSES